MDLLERVSGKDLPHCLRLIFVRVWPVTVLHWPFCNFSYARMTSSVGITSSLLPALMLDTSLFSLLLFLNASFFTQSFSFSLSFFGLTFGLCIFTLQFPYGVQNLMQTRNMAIISRLNLLALIPHDVGVISQKIYILLCGGRKSFTKLHGGH